MSQSVQLDMEVLQRFKFLMEYDVMKTSSENILLEQSTDLQKLAKEKGFGPVSISKAQELYNQGKLGNKKLDLMVRYFQIGLIIQNQTHLKLEQSIYHQLT